MSIETADPSNGKPKRRPIAKTSVAPGSQKIKATIHLTMDSHRRLSVHAAMMNVDRSELVESLVQTHLKRFVVSDRGGGSELVNNGKEEIPIA